MAQLGAKGPGSSPKPPPVPGPAGAPARAPVAPRFNTKATLIGVTPPPATVAKATAPLAPKAPVAARARLPSSADVPVPPSPARSPDPSPHAPETSSPASDAGARITPVASVVHTAETPKRLPAAAPTTPDLVSLTEPKPTFESAPQPREDAGALARAAVMEGLAPLHITIRELVRRIEDLERRPLQTTLVASPAAPIASAATHEAQRPATQTSAAGMAPSSVAMARPAAPVDLASVDVEMDGALDGARRRRRLALTFVILVLVVFGGLFGALANSYTPHT